VKATS